MTAPDISPEEQRALDEVRTRLTAMFPSDDVATIVAESHRRFDGGKIRDFVPLFVERDVRTRLADARS